MLRARGKTSSKTYESKSKDVSTHAAVNRGGYQKGLLEGLLPIATVVVPSDSTNVSTLVLCDGASTHSWVSAFLF